MADVTVIGRGANIVGTVSGAVDLTIHGRVEGEVSVDGDVVIEGEGLVAANVSARQVTIRGAVKGDVKAEDSIRLEDGARVQGDLRAPRVAITKGALVRGYVQTGGPQAVDSGSRAASRAVRGSRHEPTVPARLASPVRTPESDSIAGATRRAHAPTLLAGTAPKPTPKGPPPPVVPALRKGSKGQLKKRAS